MTGYKTIKIFINDHNDNIIERYTGTLQVTASNTYIYIYISNYKLISLYYLTQLNPPCLDFLADNHMTNCNLTTTASKDNRLSLSQYLSSYL